MADRVIRARMRKQWREIPALNYTTTTAQTLVAGQLDFTAPATVLRMLCEYIVGPEVPADAGDAMFLTLAVGVVSTDAANLGFTAMPDPSGDSDYPWLYWAQHPIFIGQAITAVAGAGVMGDQGNLRAKIDIKSMRKISAKQTLIWVSQYTNFTGNPPINVGLGKTRVLVGLH